MSAWRISGVALVLTLVVAVVCFDWELTRQESEGVTAGRSDQKATLSERTTPPYSKPAGSLPAEDVPGKDIVDLPRYPGSVRVEYERKGQDLLVFTRVRYLSHARVDVIRGFYRGVFRSERWQVANVEFSESKWTFLVVHGQREVDIEIEPHGRGVTKTDIVASEPLKETNPNERPRNRRANSAPPQPSPSASPAPGDDYFGEDDLDEGGDD